MKRIFSMIIPLFIGFSLSAQAGVDKLLFNPELKTDKVIEYTWDNETDDWTFKNMIQYTYSYENGVTQKVTVSDYYTGIPISQTIHAYTPEKILKESIYQNWVSGTWISTRRDLWFYNEDGVTNEELIQFIQNDSWVNSIRYTDYQYDNHRLRQYTYQTWTNEEWINTFYDIWHFDSRGNLVLREQIRVNGIPINKFTYLVDDTNLRQNLTLYNWVNEAWAENYRWLYEYNACRKLNAMVIQHYKNGDWVNTSRHEYFYTFNTENIHPGERIPICHNGHTIYVSVDAIKAHIAHGDCLGECSTEKKPGNDISESESIMAEKPPFTIYPNPASDMITIKFEEDNTNEIKRIELTDFCGKLLKSFNVKNSSDLTISRDGLISGKYYIRLVGKERFSAVVIFE